MTNIVADAVKLAGERLDAWISELRNPARKQTKSILKNADGAQCCLGVLCDIAGMESVREGYRYAYIGPVTGTADYTTQPPACVANSVGMKQNGLLNHPDGEGWVGLRGDSERSLMYLNDSADWTFAQIADLLEANKARVIETVQHFAEKKAAQQA